MIFFDKVISRFYPKAKEIKFVAAHGDMYEAEKLVAALVKLFTPLSASIYSKKYVVAIDQQKITKEQFTMLMQRIPDFDKEKQLKELNVGSLEQYYPVAKKEQLDALSDRDKVDSWKKTAEEVSNMTSRQKKRLATIVGENIEKEQFEAEMPLLHETLNLAIKTGF